MDDLALAPSILLRMTQLGLPPLLAPPLLPIPPPPLPFVSLSSPPPKEVKGGPLHGPEHALRQRQAGALVACVDLNRTVSRVLANHVRERQLANPRRSGEESPPG